MLTAVASYGAPPAPAGDAAATKGEAQDAKIYEQLVGAWREFYNGKYERAVKAAEPLLNADESHRWMALEAAHIQARSYWAEGSRRGRSEARKRWGKLEEHSKIPAVGRRAQIAKALQLAAEGEPEKLDSAIATLTEVLRQNASDSSTVEAAIELGTLQTRARQFEAATQTLKTVEPWVKRTLLLENPEAYGRPFIDAARAGLKEVEFAKDAGKKEFEAAEKLRRSDKFAEAARAYKVVSKKFPETDYAPRSEFCIGHCYVGAGEPAQAVRHWTKFIEGTPAGAWRGQAYVELIDVALEQELNLQQAGKYAEPALASLPTALADKSAADSWAACGYDLNLRLGLVQFARGQGKAAAECFAKAAKLTDRKLDAERANKLAEVARTDQPVLPKDVLGTPDGPSDKPSTALAMGILYYVAGRYDNAETMFDRVLGAPATDSHPTFRRMSDATKPQLAFASYGKGAVYHDTHKPDEALEYLHASMKTYDEGTWHDATLYRMASVMASKAQKVGAGLRVAERRDASSPIHRLSKADRAKLRADLAKARQQELADRKAILPLLEKLRRQYPESPLRMAAACLEATVLAEAGQPEQAVRVAQQALEISKAGTASSRIATVAGTVALLDLLDLARSRSLVTPAIAWAMQEGDDSPPSPQQSPEVWAPAAQELALSSVRSIRYRALLLGGILAYLDRNYPEATKLFEVAQRHAPRSGGSLAFGDIAAGVEAMVEVVKSKRILTPESVLEGDPRASLALQLSGVYHHIDDYERELQLCDGILASPGEATQRQRSWALYRRGRAKFCSEGLAQDVAGATVDYLAAQRTDPDASWSARCLFLAANIRFNRNQDYGGAIELWRQIRSRYPKAGDAERSAYYIGIAFRTAKDYGQARKAFDEFLTAYPDSPFARIVRTYQYPRLAAAEKAARQQAGEQSR